MAVASADPIQLRDQPGWESAALLDLMPGASLEVSGAAQIAPDGAEWVPVVADGVFGFLPSWAVGEAWTGAATDGEIAAEQPAAETAADAAPTESIEAAPADVGAPAMTDPGEAPADAEPVADPAPVATLYVSEDVNLRAGPQPDAEVLSVLPAATAVNVSGEAVDGYVPVSGGGIDGWIASEYLAGAAPAPEAAAADAEGGAVAAPEPAPDAVPAAASELAAKGRPGDGKDDRSGAEKPASVIAFPFRGGTWQVIQGYNGGTHTNRSDFAKYKYAIDWARVDGDTAGAPIYAPVGGSIGWTDPGSGGLMIDTGAGWGIVLFHVVPDRGIGAGGMVEQGERIGRICAPGDPGYMNADHVETDVWILNGDGSHDSIPFTGEFTIGGYDFPDVGGNNQHMNFKVSA